MVRIVSIIAGYATMLRVSRIIPTDDALPRMVVRSGNHRADGPKNCHALISISNHPRWR